MSNIFKSVLAFLLANNLLSHELVFLTDGAKDIKSHIEAVFQFHPYIVILDWFHLKKRCQEWLSMAIRGKKKRNAILKKLLRLLWVGNVSGALDALQMIYLNYQSDLWFRKKELYRLSELCNIGKVA